MRPFSGASIGNPSSSFDDAKLNTARRRMDVEAPPKGRVAAKAAADAALFGLALIAACEAGEAGEGTTYANADSGAAAATRKTRRAAVLTPNIIVAIACDDVLEVEVLLEVS